MAIEFPHEDTMVQYLEGQFQSTGDRKIIGALSSHVRKYYPDAESSPYDYYLATCSHLGVAA